MNSTLEQEMATNHVYMFLVIYTFIIIFIITGKSLVLWMVYKVLSLHTVTNMFTAHLSMIDLITGVLALPLSMITNLILPHMNDIHVQSKYLCLVQKFLILSCNGISVLGLLGIAIERYIAIIHPLRYSTMMAAKNAKIILVTFWTYAISLNLLLFIDGFNDYEPGQRCTMKSTLNPIYSTFYKLNILAVVILTIIMYSRISWVSIKHRRAIISQLASIDNARAVAYAKEHSALRTTTLVYIIFVIMYGQAMIMLTLNVNGVIMSISEAILQLNSGVNPWIYVLYHRRYRRAMRIALNMKPKVTDSPDTGVTSHPENAM
ncbi:unnamed protein product [Owenia fusiformis]|uniref:Uncharacterized protein n=1 Tax=Owenia fusiformis TaxID=6347 RepID=A0A8J1TLT1_OWEFU|nr:unnamed protein product [Owenia fusiformis]